MRHGFGGVFSFVSLSLGVSLVVVVVVVTPLPSSPLLPLPPPPPPLLLLLLLLLLRRRRFHCWLDFVFPVLFSYSPWIRNPSSSLSLSLCVSLHGNPFPLLPFTSFRAQQEFHSEHMAGEVGSWTGRNVQCVGREGERERAKGAPRKGNRQTPR